MKVIFLDIDGVLASFDYIRVTHLLKEKNPDKYGYGFDPRCIKNLEFILREHPDAKIVIASSWKSMGYVNILDMWVVRNFPGEVIGMTPDLLRTAKSSSRGAEIEEWLNNSEEDIEGYVILDDDSNVLMSQLNHFVKTDPMFGLSVEDVWKADRILREEKV